jgi:hypothetical protein
MTSCVVCHTPLSGGCDTFGLPDAPLCLRDWYAAIAEGKAAVDSANETARSMGLPPMDVDELTAGTMMLAIGEEL